MLLLASVGTTINTLAIGPRVKNNNWKAESLRSQIDFGKIKFVSNNYLEPYIVLIKGHLWFH